MKIPKKTPAFLIVFYLLICFTPQVMGQEPDLEHLFDSETDKNENSILEYLLYVQEHPFDLNKVSYDELQTIPWITPLHAQLIINYRERHKGFSEVEELNRIGEIQPIFESIKFFFTVRRKPEKRFSVSGRHRFILKKQKSRGYQEGIYEGDRSKVYNRIRGSVSDMFSFGLLTEKDPGEKQYNDLATGYGQVYLSRFKSTLYFGNFLVEGGQGLVFWGPYQLNKGNNPVAVVKKQGRGILPYTSVDENNSFSGVGLKTVFGAVECAGFYSYTCPDANVQNDSIYTLQKSGYHRYGNEIKNKDSIREKVTGGYVKWQRPGFHLGTHWQSDVFSDPFSRQTATSRMNGKGNIVGGVDYGLTAGQLHFYGEAAKSRNSGINYAQGALWNLNSIDLILSLRKYRNDFVNIHGRGFGENEDLTNEQAVYFGWRWRVQPATTTAFYFDLFRHPVYEQNFRKPVNGWELMGNVEHRFFRGLSVFLRLRIKSTQLFQNTYDRYGNKNKKLFNKDKSSIRAQIDYQVKRQLRFRTRFEYSWLSWNKYHIKSSLIDSSAVLFYQDISYKFQKGFSIRLRMTLYDAPISDLRFYVYENDLPGVLRLKVLNHRGSRIYLLTGYKWKKHLNINVKYEHTFYDNKNSIGSGYDLIYGDHDNMLSVQLDWNR